MAGNPLAARLILFLAAAALALDWALKKRPMTPTSALHILVCREELLGRWGTLQSNLHVYRSKREKVKHVSP